MLLPQAPPPVTPPIVAPRFKRLNTERWNTGSICTVNPSGKSEGRGRWSAVEMTWISVRSRPHARQDDLSSPERLCALGSLY